MDAEGVAYVEQQIEELYGKKKNQLYIKINQIIRRCYYANK